MSPGFATSVRQRVERRELRALRQDALGDHARQDPLAVGFVAVVELALVLVDVFLRGMVRGMVGARAEPHVPRLRGIAGLLVADHLRWPGRPGPWRGDSPPPGVYGCVDEAVVFDEVGIPLVGLAAEEAVEAVEALLERPLLAARARGAVRLGDVVVLAQPEGAPAAVLEDLPDRGALVRDAAVLRRGIRSPPP